MPSSYPGGLDNFTTARGDSTPQASTHATEHNNVNDALNKIEAELGLTPKSADASVAARLARIDTTLVALGTTPQGSDASVAARLARLDGAWFNVRNPVYAGGAKGDGSTDDTAAIVAVLDAINTAGGGVLFFPPTSSFYKYSSIYKVMTAPLTIFGYGSTLKSTLGKTSNTIAFQLEGNRISILGLTFDYTIPLVVDTDAPGPVQGHILRLGNTAVSIFYTDCLVRDCTFKNARNTFIDVLGYSRCRIIDNTCDTSLGNGIFIGDNPFDTIIRGNTITNTGDDGIAVVSDAALPALCKRVVIEGNTVEKSYGHGIDLTGVDGATVDHNHIEKTWGNGIIAWHDTTDSLGTCKNVYIGDGNIIKDAGQYFGGGQFKTTATGAACGVTLTGDVSEITVGYPIIINPNVAPMSWGATGAGTIRRTGLPPQKFGNSDFIKTIGTSVGTFVLSADVMYAVPVIVPRLVTVTSLNVNVTSGGTAGSVMRLGIYNDSGDFSPKNRVLDAGTVATTTTGVKTITISQVLTPGVYWLVGAGQGAPATQPTVNTVTGQPLIMPSVQDPATSISCFYNTAITGALPSTFTIQGLETRGIAMTLGSHS